MIFLALSALQARDRYITPGSMCFTGTSIILEYTQHATARYKTCVTTQIKIPEANLTFTHRKQGDVRAHTAYLGCESADQNLKEFAQGIDIIEKRLEDTMGPIDVVVEFKLVGIPPKEHTMHLDWCADSKLVDLEGKTRMEYLVELYENDENLANVRSALISSESCPYDDPDEL